MKSFFMNKMIANMPYLWLLTVIILRKFLMMYDVWCTKTEKGESECVMKQLYQSKQINFDIKTVENKKCQCSCVSHIKSG